MTISEAIATYLLSDSALSALIGTRLYPEASGQDETLPYVVYHVEIRRAEESTDGLVNLFDVTFQARSVSGDYDEAFEVSDALRDALEFFNGLMGGASGLQVTACSLDNIVGGYVPDWDLFSADASFVLQYVQ